MSRSGYDDYDADNWALIRWRGAVASAIRGRRGQAFLRELVEALDALPERRLIANAAEVGGDYCALGAVAARRGLDLRALDAAMQDEDRDAVAQMLGIPEALAAEIMWENDWIEWAQRETYEVVGPLRPYESRLRTRWVYDPTAPSRRWRWMRDWVARNLQGAPRGAA